jgi:hypothetical protein
MQRTRLDRSQVGEFTKYQARLQCNGDAKAGDELLDSILKNEVTLTRRSFDKDAAECMSCDMFRFLVLERGFHSYKIEHFIHYNVRDHLNPYILDKLERRHQIKKAKGSELMSSLLKLIREFFLFV